MTQLSKIAAIACCAIVTIGTTACNDSKRSVSSTSIPTAPVNDCVPEAVKAPATLDQNSTAVALSAALVSEEIGYMLSDGGMLMGVREAKGSEKEPKKVSKLASMLSAKVQTLQQNTASVKKSISESVLPVEEGDAIACDLGGTYSFHAEFSSTGMVEDAPDSGTSMNKLTLSFDACVMDNTDYSNELSFFYGITMFSSILNRMNYSEAGSSTTTFNGALSLEFNNEYAYTSSSLNEIPAPRDAGYREDRENSGTSHFVTEGLSVEYKVDNATLERFASTQELSVAFDSSYSYENNTIYENPTNEGNYTSNSTDKEQYTLNGSFKGSETQQYFGDEENTTTSLSACNVSFESTSEENDTEKEIYVVEGDSSTYTYENLYTRSYTSKLSGYIALQDGEEGFDLYADALTVNYKETDDDNIDSGELSLSGTVGSTLMGGSVVLATPTPWLMSSAYPNHRGDAMLPEAMAYNYLYPEVDYSPYAGKTVLTGTNTATVEFMKDTMNVTYGTITIEGQEPVEYDSIEDMGIAQIWNYDY